MPWPISTRANFRKINWFVYDFFFERRPFLQFQLSRFRLDRSDEMSSPINVSSVGLQVDLQTRQEKSAAINGI